MLSVVDEVELVRQWQENRDLVARDRMICSHMRICYAMAARWSQNESHVRDLAQEGVFGLSKALDKFDPERGIRFGSYAKWWVKSSVEAALGGVALSVDVPSRVYRRAKGAEPAQGHEDVVPWEARVAVRGEVALDAPMGDGTGDDSLMDMLADSRPNPEQVSVEEDRVQSIKRALADALEKAMTEREAEVLRRRDLSENPETLEGIAASMGISRERVRQIQVAAMFKLRRHLVNTNFPVGLLRIN